MLWTLVFKHLFKSLVYIQFNSVQLLSRVRLFATLWIAACQASLSITISQSSLKLTSIESVMPSSHLILCRPLLLLPPIPPSIRVFSNESTLRMRWPKYWSFSFIIIPSKEHPGLNWTDWLKWLSLPPPNGLVRNHLIMYVFISGVSVWFHWSIFLSLCQFHPVLNTIVLH